MELFNKKTVLEDLQDKVSAYNTALSSAQEALDLALEKQAEATAAMESSADLNDAEAFSNAKRRLAEAETSLEMAQMRKDRIMKKGAISKSDADSAEAWYKKKLLEIDKEAAKQIVEHIEEICRIVKKVDVDSCSVAKDYSAALKLLDKEIPSEIRGAHPNRIYEIMRWERGVLFEGLSAPAKDSLYRLAGRKP